MVNENDKANQMELKEYRTLTKDLSNTFEVDKSTSETNENISEYVLLFFSFDIVNSVQYKTISNVGWATFIHKILFMIRQKVRSRIKDAEVWRILGDEVVFVVKIRDNEALFEYIEKIYEILIQYCELVENEEFDSIMDTNSYEMQEILKAKNVISLQASAWIAIVADKEKNDLSNNYNLDNIFEVIEDNPDNKFFEFMGADIDAGFRISKFTRARRLVLSFELACLLAAQRTYAERMHIITYRVLKGIWNGTLYPIIWYYDELKNIKNGSVISFDESIPFDAKELDDIYKDITSDEFRFDEYLFKDTAKALSKIKFDRCLSAKIDRLKQKISSKDQSDETSIFKNTKLELHCAAVCFKKDKKVLIARRSENRKFYPGKYEFGCAKANSKEKLVEIIEKEYKDDFGIEIKVITDSDRVDEQPMPVAIYEVEKQGELHKGIIVLAQIESGRTLINKEKHSDYRYVSEEELNEYSEEDFVPDGLDTLRKTFVYLNRRDEYEK